MDNILSAVESSQHCQRNWDLGKTIDPEHLKIFEYVLKTVPSKQNITFYKAHFIFNRSIIEEIYKNTNTFHPNTEVDFYNPQILSNLLVVFEDVLEYDEVNENNEIIAYKLQHLLTPQQKSKIEKNLNNDRQQAIGIASGQLSLIANYLGYKTGFCGCYNINPIAKLLNTENRISLLLGIGYPNSELLHNAHHLDNDYFSKVRPKAFVNISTII
jgi:hypothetical protein